MGVSSCPHDGHHGGVTAPRWEPVDQFAADAPTDDMMAALEAVVPHEGQRLATPQGARAMLVPVEALPAELVPDPALPASAAVLFVDPPTVATALSVLTVHGTARSVWIALPEGADSTGLSEGGGRVPVVVVPGGPEVQTLFRTPDPAGEQRARLAAAPRIGESADVLDERSKWFGAREDAED